MAYYLKEMLIKLVTSRIKALEEYVHLTNLGGSRNHICLGKRTSFFKSAGRIFKTFLKKSKFSGIPFAILYGLFLYAYINFMILPNERKEINNIKKPLINISMSCSRLFKHANNRTLNSIIRNGTIESRTVKKTLESPVDKKNSESHNGGNSISTSASVAFSLTFIIANVSIFSKHVRCMMVLVLPGLITGRGRAILMTLVIGMLVDGPVNSINYNINEVTESNVCMYESIKGMACSYATQMKHTIKQAFETINKQREEMMQDLKAISDRLKQLVVATTQEMEQRRRQIRDRLKKLNGKINNLKGIMNAFRKPCNVVETGVESVNDFSKKVASFSKKVGKTIASWFGKKRRKRRAVNCASAIPEIPSFDEELNLESLRELNTWTKDLVPDLDFPKLEAPDLDNLLKVPNVASISEKIVKTVSKVFQVMKEYLQSAKRFLMVVSMLLLVYLSYQYLQKYYSDDSFDNQFIDNNIRDLWRNGSYSKLTPLRHWELNARYQVSVSPRLTKKELKRIVVMMLPTCVMCLMVIIIMLGDYALAKLLSYLAVNGKFALSFEGMEGGYTLNKSMLNFTYNQDFSLKLEKVDLSTAPCLPRPIFTNEKKTIMIFVLLVVMVFLCFFDAYFSRVRAQICNLFYNERAIERGEYLYERLESGRNIRRLRFQMIISKELKRRRKLEEFSWFQHMLKSKWQEKHKPKDIVCPGCFWKTKMVETTSIRINELDTLICTNCALDV